MKLIATAILAALMAAPAFAQDQVAKVKYISAFDTDKSGHMTVAEHNAGRTARFDGMDANKDGKLNKEEFTNGHGDWHDKADANKDGIVELGEYVTFFCGEEPKQGDPKKHQDSKKHYVDCVAHRHAVYMAEDASKDGKVTAEEHKAASAAAFDKMDKNGDQMIALDEFYAFQVEIDSAAPAAKECPNKKAGCPKKMSGECKGDCKCKGGCKSQCKGNGECKKAAAAKAEVKAEAKPEAKAPVAATPAPATTADKK